MNERGVLRGFDECRGRTQPVRLEDSRHLGDRQSLGERERDDEHVAARDLVDHFASGVIARSNRYSPAFSRRPWPLNHNVSR